MLGSPKCRMNLLRAQIARILNCAFGLGWLTPIENRGSGSACSAMSLPVDQQASCKACLYLVCEQAPKSPKEQMELSPR